MIYLKQALRVLLYPFKVTLLTLLGLLIPRHGKRIMFVTSVYLHLAGEKSPDRPVLIKLNEALKLAQTEEALLLPARLYQYFWNERLEDVLCLYCPKEMLHGNVDPFQVAGVCNLLVASTPHWLRYGQYGDMVKDTMKALQSARSHSGGRLQMA